MMQADFGLYGTLSIVRAALVTSLVEILEFILPVGPAAVAVIPPFFPLPVKNGTVVRWSYLHRELRRLHVNPRQRAFGQPTLLQLCLHAKRKGCIGGSSSPKSEFESQDYCIPKESFLPSFFSQTVRSAPLVGQHISFLLKFSNFLRLAVEWVSRAFCIPPNLEKNLFFLI